MTGIRGALRIGMVCPYSFDVPGGVQNHVLGLARYLRQSGHRPYVLAPGELDPAAQRDVEDFASVGGAVPVRYNGSVARVNFGPLSASRVRRWVRKGKFDLLHIHEPINPSVSLLALWAAEQPVVATFHTATPRSRSLQLAGGVLRAAVEKIDAGIAVSESARNVVVQHLGRDAVVIPNGIEFDAFANATQPHADHPKLIFLGRLDEPRKGLDVLLAAVPLIFKDHPDLEVIVAGQGSRQLPGWCHNLGTISELPSFVDLIGSSHDDLRLGEVFAAGDHRALAAAVLRVLNQPNLVRAARAQQAARRYDWSRVGATVHAVYRAALGAAPDRWDMATPLDRAQARAERTWAALDAALVRRAELALELIVIPGIDPATALLLLDTAAAALEPNLSRRDRERAESDLSHVLDAVGSMLPGSPNTLDSERARASICRRLHNDAVATALSVRRRYAVGTLRSPDRAAEPRPFEMADSDLHSYG